MSILGRKGLGCRSLYAGLSDGFWSTGACLDGDRGLDAKGVTGLLVVLW